MKTTKIRVVTEEEEFASLKAVWNRLLQKCGESNSIYLTHEWLSIWWRHFGEGKKLNILLIEQEHQVIGIVPLMKVECRIAVIKIHVLETIGSVNCNYIGFILPELMEDAMTAFLAYLEEELAKNRLLLRLNLIPEESLFLNWLQKHAVPLSKNILIQEKATTLAPYIKLPSSWDDYFSSLSRRRRKVLRRALRSLKKRHGVNLQEYTSESLDEGLSKFFDLHQSRWRAVNVRGAFSNPKMKEFYRDIASQFLKNKWLYFTCLSADNEPVSIEYGFIYNQKLYSTTVARDIRYSEYSVGHLHRLFQIDYAIKRHLRELDFLRGDEPYKFHWTKSARRYIQVMIKRNGFGSRLSLRLIRLYFRLLEISRYNLKEIYSLYFIKRREKKQKKQMGLDRLI